MIDQHQQRVETQTNAGKIDTSLSGEFHGTVNINQYQTPPVTFKPGSAPPLPPLIIGREDALHELKARLGSQPGSAVQALTAIRGWPGIGKTTMA